MSLGEPTASRPCGAPRDALEFQLVQIWEDLLGVRPIGVDDEFVQLGGDSLQAMSLLARVAQETGLNVPMAGIVSTVTVARLARLLRDESPHAQWSPLVPFRTEGRRRPLFMVHPGGGNVLCYLRLSELLAHDRPFYGLQCPGVDGERPLLATAEELAGEYVAALRRVQPQGPYALGGWSVGGVLAFEMAQQLRAAGQQVSPLAILDSGVLYACALIAIIFPKGQLGALDLLRMPPHEQLAEFRRRSAPARLIPDNAGDELATRIMRLFTSNMRAMVLYRPQAYDDTITLFQAAESLVKPRFEPRREWRQVCRQVAVQRVPGNHLTMIHEPHVRPLAEQLNLCLDAADQ
ncbi:MAG: alpha/beta fold hydrolase [Thermoguttaceae bacterium]|jgi:thioesterase domain-containing protein/aryl carrier-like protein